MSRTIRRKGVTVIRKSLCEYMIKRHGNGNHKEWKSYFYSDKYNLKRLSKDYKESVTNRHRTDKRKQIFEAIRLGDVSFHSSDSDAKKRTTDGWGYY